MDANSTQPTEVEVAEFNQLFDKHEAFAGVIAATKQEVLQALGNGELTATYLSISGMVTQLMCESWRGESGDIAIASGLISISDGRDDISPNKCQVFVQENCLARWLEPPKDLAQSRPTGSNAQTPPFDSIGKATNPSLESYAIDGSFEREGESETRRKPPSRPAFAERSKELFAWMRGYAQGFKENGKILKREEAIKAAVANWKCTTREAEAAFAALPFPDLRYSPRTPLL